MASPEKTRIVIASVLKPVNDTRMFEKMARTFVDASRFEVHVIGFPAEVAHGEIKIHKLPFFSRLSIQRLTAPFKVLQKIVSIKPDIVIITTHELLFIGSILRLFIRCKLIYDIQENYYRNILNSGTFNTVLSPFVAGYVRTKEFLLSPFINHFILAERGYEKELSFIRRRYTIIENKVRRDSINNSGAAAKRGKAMLFTGTLAESTGVFTAIEIALKLHDIDPAISLKIIGFCPTEHVFFKIVNTIEPYPFIELIGGKNLVSHDQIMREICRADFGIVSYHINPSTEGSIPTKLYEYLGAELPILLTNHPPWVGICEEYAAAVVFNPENLDPQNLYKKMQKGVFYLKKPQAVFWETEIPQLLKPLEAH